MEYAKNDFTLLKEIKEEKSLKQNLEILYKRYFPMINKYSSRLFSDEGTKQDYKQEAYLVMLEAIKSTNLDIITYNSDKWLFVGRLGFYLKNLKKKYIKKSIKNLKNLKNLDSFEGTNIVGYSQGFNDSYFEIYERIESKINTGTCISNRLIKINQNHLSVLNYRLQGYSLEEIRKMMNKSYGWVHFKLEHLSYLIIEEFGIEYSF